LRIGIDLMGSDCSPLVLFDAVLEAARHLEVTETLVVFATQDVVDNISHKILHHLSSSKSGRIVFHIVEEAIMMNDEPLTAVRHKKKSSLITGIRQIKKKQIDAFVSAGNTGALIASATLYMSLFPGIQRPALLTTLPSKNGEVAVLDVGGNVAPKARHLVQFAFLGTAYHSCFHPKKRPRIGLLNIGVESKKGTSELRQAYQILEDFAQKGSHIPFEFIGNIEGRELFEGKVDVLVTDGFTGNVLLKTAEGTSLFILDHLVQFNRQNPSDGLARSIEELQKRFNYNEYPGAILCGVDGLVIKCHGSSSPKTMFNGIMGAVKLVRKGFIRDIRLLFPQEKATDT
jgi:phosphate acyltransferase